MSKTAYNISLKGYVGGYDFDRTTFDRRLADEPAPRLTDALASAMANAGMPIPNLPIAETEQYIFLPYAYVSSDADKINLHVFKC